MVEIRKASFTDILGIYNCNSTVLPIYYSLDEHLFFLLSSDMIVLVAYEGSELLGYLIAQYTLPTVHIMSFGVYEKHRRKGVGNKLISKMEEITKENKSDIKKISLYVHADNIGGIKFYKKNGFKKIKTLHNYYKGSLKNAKTQDAYRLERDLTS